MRENFLQVQHEFNDSIPECILYLMNARNQFKFFHWQTNSYSEHNSFESFAGDLECFLDNFVEAYQGKYDRIKILGDGHTTQFICNYESIDGMEYLRSIYDCLQNRMRSCLKDEDSDLVNLIDEMVLKLNKLLYLLTLE